MYHCEWPGAVSVAHRVGAGCAGQLQFTHSSLPSAKRCSFQIGISFFTSSTSRAQISNASRAMRGRHSGDQGDVTDRELPDPVAHGHGLDPGQRREPRGDLGQHLRPHSGAPRRSGRRTGWPWS